MKIQISSIVMVGLLIGGIAPSVYGQQDQPQLMEIFEVQVKPELAAQYEAAVKEQMAWRQDNGFPFPIFAFQLGLDNYRFVTRLGNWSGRDQVNQWFAALITGNPPAFVEPLTRSTDSVSISYQLTRPAISYRPDNPRVSPGTANAIHELRLHPKPGTMLQVQEALERFVAVYADHDIRGGKAVWRQVAGTDGPVITHYFSASSTEAFYANRATDMQEMGPDFQDLVQELTPLLRKLENLDWTTRRDLGYQP